MYAVFIVGVSFKNDRYYMYREFTRIIVKISTSMEKLSKKAEKALKRLKGCKEHVKDCDIRNFLDRFFANKRGTVKDVYKNENCFVMRHKIFLREVFGLKYNYDVCDDISLDLGRI